MKTLYVSDLDGTLLKSDETLSEFTVNTVNSLIKQGMLFSYATARSRTTAVKAAGGLEVSLPVVLYNGVFIADIKTGEILASNRFGEDVKALIGNMFENGLCPLVYSFIDNAERFSYVSSRATRGLNAFLAKRKGDKRACPADSEEALYGGDIFYVNCIDEKDKLAPFYEKYKDKYRCIFYKEQYTGEQWLEIMPMEATKANAVLKLKEMLHCDRLVVFGDGINDTDMFAAADECYAPENADEALKKLADGMIEANDCDGVARWLAQNWTAVCSN